MYLYKCLTYDKSSDLEEDKKYCAYYIALPFPLKEIVVTIENKLFTYFKSSILLSSYQNMYTFSYE